MTITIRKDITEVNPKALTSDNIAPGPPSSEGIKEIISAKKSRGIRRLFWVFGIVIFVVGPGAFFLWKLYFKAPTDNGRVQLKMTTVTRGDLLSVVSATGNIEARNAVEVGAELSGRIVSLGADFNQTVAAGDLLAEIDREQYLSALAEARAKLQMARATVAETQANLDEASRESTRGMELASKGLISEKETSSLRSGLLRAEAAVQSAKANQAIAQANLQSAKTNLSKTRILSPISGVVLSRKVEEGQTINAGMETPVLYIIAESLTKMRLSCQVDEADIGKVKVGQEARFTVDAFSGKSFPSQVSAIHNIATTEDNVVSYEVLLTVDNSQGLLKPGMTATVEVITQKYEKTLLISNTALRFSPAAGGGMGKPPGGLSFLMGKPPKFDDAKRHKETAKLSVDEKRIWLEEKNSPLGMRPLVVKKIATDGTLTAIRSPELKAGMQVVERIDENNGQ